MRAKNSLPEDWRTKARHLGARALGVSFVMLEHCIVLNYQTPRRAPRHSRRRRQRYVADADGELALALTTSTKRFGMEVMEVHAVLWNELAEASSELFERRRRRPGTWQVKAALKWHASCFEDDTAYRRSGIYADGWRRDELRSQETRLRGKETRLLDKKKMLMDETRQLVAMRAPRHGTKYV